MILKQRLCVIRNGEAFVLPKMTVYNRNMQTLYTLMLTLSIFYSSEGLVVAKKKTSLPAASTAGSSSTTSTTTATATAANPGAPSSLAATSTVQDKAGIGAEADKAQVVTETKTVNGTARAGDDASRDVKVDGGKATGTGNKSVAVSGGSGLGLLGAYSDSESENSDSDR